MHTRAIRSAVAAAMLLLSLSVTTVLAGGGATVVPDDAQPPEPRAGEEVEFGFTVMQHGVTPAGWEDPTVHATNALTGETYEFRATPEGADGHFVARISLPAGGLYEWSFTLSELVVTSPPIMGTVLAADGSTPAIGVADAFTAIETARRTLSMELREEFNRSLDLVQANLDGLRAQDQRSRAELELAIDERTALAARIAELESNPGAAGSLGAVPLVATLTLAVLAGALAGFAMVWLGTRREAIAVDPLPRGGTLTTD
jgi:hypothetical protein